MKPLRIGPLLITPPVLQAPMAGFTDHAYRQITGRLGGVGLPATEMVSARGFLGRQAHARSFPEQLWGIFDEPRPLAVQIWDNDPESLAAVGQRLVQEFHVSVVDINFGCPAHNVTERAQSGAYLLGDPARIGRIVERVAAACAPAPVTAKIRLGASRDTINAIDVAQAVEASGGAAVTVHGRTVADRFGGRADWDEIARIKPHLQRIPLIGNGDLATPQQVVEAFARYGVDGLMIGRAGLARPWLYAQVAAALRGEPIPPEPSLPEQKQLLLEHYRLVVEQFGPAKGTILMRKLACCYARRRDGSRAFRAAVGRVATREEFLAAVDGFFTA